MKNLLKRAKDLLIKTNPVYWYYRQEFKRMERLEKKKEKANSK